ncbi:MAG: hypothetical protein WBX29_11065, partial [Nitrososphaeraceae archaeon]
FPHPSRSKAESVSSIKGMKYILLSSFRWVDVPKSLPSSIMGPRNVRESRRLIHVFNKIGIKNNKGRSKKPERILVDTCYHTSLE